MRYYALLLAVSFITRFPSLFVGVVDADEAVYANTARGILRGLVPYRDVIDQKPPFIYYIYALFLGIVNDLRFLHAITIVIVWLTAIVVYRLVTRCLDKHSGVVAGILYAAFVSTVGYSSNTEVFMNLPLVLAVWMFFVRPRRISLMFVAGICVGFAGLFKQQAVVVMLPLCLMIIVTRLKGGIGRGLCEFASLILGAALPFVIVLLYFLRLGIMHDFIEWAYLYNMRYIAPESGILLVLANAALLAILPAIILWWYSLKRIGALRSGGQECDRGAIVFGLLWLVASVYAVALGQRFYTHYFVQLIPPLVFLAAQPIAERLVCHCERSEAISLLPNLKARLLRRFTPRNDKSLISNIVFFFFLIVPSIFITVSFGIKVAIGGFDCQKPPIVWASEFVEAHSKPNDHIFVWGDALVEYLADRPSSSRFMNAAFVIENRDPCYPSQGADVLKYAGTKEFGMLMDDLKKNPPLLIVDTSSSEIHCWQNYPIDKFAPLSNLIRKRYKNVGEYDGVRVYRLQ